MKKLMPFLFSVIGINAACANPHYENLNVEKFEKLIKESNVIILDVRTPEEYSEGHLHGAVNIDITSPEFIKKVKDVIPSDKKVAVYCRSGHRSVEASEKLAENGYKAYNLEGGILEWESEGLPISDNANPNFDIYKTKNGKTIDIQPLLHASIRIIYDGKEIEIDPVSKMGDRTTNYSKFPPADYILITHEHYDHLDPTAISDLFKSATVIIANKTYAEIPENLTVMKNGDTLSFPDDITIEAVPAYNTSPDRLQFHPKGRDNGYVISLDGLRIYVAGDTEVTPEMSNIKDIDIAFLPCNLPYTMTPQQFIEAAKIINPKVVYPYHYGTTDLTPIIEALKDTDIDVLIRPFD